MIALDLPEAAQQKKVAAAETASLMGQCNADTMSVVSVTSSAGTAAPPTPKGVSQVRRTSRR